jgi:hypothetical protein
MRTPKGIHAELMRLLRPVIMAPTERPADGKVDETQPSEN